VDGLDRGDVGGRAGSDGPLLAEAERVAAVGSFSRELGSGRMTFSSGFRRIFAAPADRELSRDVVLERVHPEDRELLERAVLSAERSGEPYSLELRIRRFDGRQRTIRARGMRVTDPDDELGRLVGTVQDITEEAEERAVRDLLSYVVDSSDDAILTASADGTITSWNRGAERLYGHPADEAIGAQASVVEPPGREGEQREILRRVLSGESIDHLETEHLRRDGTQINVSLTVSPVRDNSGRIVSAAVIARDITERVGYEMRLRHLADHDQLTGLVNRRRFDEELKRELARAGRHATTGALISLDVDNFKQINDSTGHAAGDAVLVEVASVLTHRFRSTDVVARLGGDEFAVLLVDVSPEDARHAAEDLREAVAASRPAFGGKPLRVTASIGVAPFDSDDVTSAELLVNADLAMYAAKDAGRNRVVLYSPTQARHARTLARQPWSDRIREALEQDNFVLYLQPIIDLSSGRVSHGELLLRMRDRNGRMIAPGAFLPTAERLGLIHQIDRWVVQHAIGLIARSGEDDLPPVGINLSGDTVVGDPQMLALIERELARHAVDPDRLIFEVTETAAIANMRDASSFARDLTELGCSLALDDFGTGFASFNYLKHLPVRFVKLDGEFIQNLPRSEIDEHMVRAIVALAQGLGIKTVAEWVSDDETIRLLRANAVDYAQGFHVGRPAPVGLLTTA